MATVDIDDLADAIIQELQEYSEEVAEQLREEVKIVAKECAKDIKNNAPVDSGDYKKGWKAKVVHESNNDIRVIVHNSKKPQLAHLLEHGHAKVGGGRVEGKPHIQPAEERAEEKLMGRVRVIVG